MWVSFSIVWLTNSLLLPYSLSYIFVVVKLCSRWSYWKLSFSQSVIWLGSNSCTSWQICMYVLYYKLLVRFSKFLWYVYCFLAYKNLLHFLIYVGKMPMYSTLLHSLALLLSLHRNCISFRPELTKSKNRILNRWQARYRNLNWLAVV